MSNAGIQPAGAGRNERQATAPLLWNVPDGQVVVFSCGARDSGIPMEWTANGQNGGVFLLDDFSEGTAAYVASLIESYRQPGTVVICSIHWGGNWGYSVPPRHRTFAHRLIDEAGVDLVHGRSSHHFKGIEVYRDKLILYGCGDFITDYEGISGKEQYRGELALAYFPVLDPVDGRLVRLEMTPMLLRRFRLHSPPRRILYSARPPQVIFDFLFSRPAALRSLADALASPTFRALQAEKIGASNFHLL